MLYMIFSILLGGAYLLASVSGSLYLLNDSPFILVAEVQSADGTALGQISLQPGEQKNAVTELNSTQLNLPNNPEVSSTPYTVIWKCAHGGYYSTCRNASPGALVQASACPGSYYCKPKKKKEKEKCCKPCPEEKSS